MLRLTFADHGDLSDALAAIVTMREWALAMRNAGLEILRGYAAGEAPFPERSHLNVLNACLYRAIYDQVIAFCDLAEAEINSWDQIDGLGLRPRTRDLLDRPLDDVP